jgi:purine catabolism regulator
MREAAGVQQVFDGVLLSGGGVAELAAALHELVGRAVAVVDAEDRTLVAVPREAEADLRGEAVVRRPIRAGGRDVATLLVAGEAAAEDEVLARAVTALGVRFAQTDAVAAANERFAAISLEALVSPHAGELDDLAERAAVFGWDLSRPRAVLLASVDPPERGTIPDAALLTIAAAARATLGHDAIVWTRSSAIAALIAPATEDAAERRRIAESLRRELDARLRSVNVSIGVGRRVDRLDDLPRSFAEASRAVDVGRWAKGRHVTEVFDQLGLERLLAAAPTDTLVAFVHDAIGQLVAYDHANQTELLDTLAVWLDTRNMAEAARRMSVHYNTMKNRLERIEEIIGPVMSDAAHSLECEVAIYIDRHYDVAWRGPSD